MKGTAKKRRRWLWLAIFLAILLVGVVAWRFRPLNGTEKTLVGTWQIISDLPGTRSYRLAPDRSYTETWVIPGRPDIVTRGVWRASETSLHFTVDELIDITPLPWHRRLRLAVVTRWRKPSEIRFEGPDRFWRGSIQHLRVAD